MRAESAADHRLFPHPFSSGYWKCAAGELKSLRVLVVAALITALRIAIKSVKIPILPGLNITFGFLFNATGSLIYGPIVAILTSAISDTLGAILFPSGVYFVPFIFEEIAGGVLFALFYYRARLSVFRVALGRFAVTVLVNLMLSPFIQIFYYQYVLGKSYAFLSLPRMIKNAALFPVQTLILVLLFKALIPLTNRPGLTHTGTTRLTIQKKDVITLIVLTLISAGAIALYALYQAGGGK